MNLYTINVLNKDFRLDTPNRILAFKNKNQACKIVTNWLKYNKVALIFEIKKVEFKQLSTTKNILIINDLNQDYYPCSLLNVKETRDAMEEVWTSL